MPAKSLSTPAKILNILKLLIEKPVSINKLMDSLEQEDTYVARDTITKYFATLKVHGASIKKNAGKYHINYPLLNLTEENLETLAKFQKAVEDLGSIKDRQMFDKILNKLFPLLASEEVENYKEKTFELTNNETPSLKLSKKYKDKIQALSDFLGENATQIKLKFNNEEFNVVPLDFIYCKNSVSILCYDTKRNVNRSFLLDKITDIKNVHKSANLSDFSRQTTFQISNRLKRAYILKEGETAHIVNNSIIITNSKEDKKELFNRLLKYGTNCEVLYPESDRKSFIKMVKNLKERKL